MENDLLTEASDYLLPRPERPLEALAQVTEARATLDRLERLLVRSARMDWATWEEIGAVLGISRQAAHRRYHPRAKRTSTERAGAATATDTAT